MTTSLRIAMISEHASPLNGAPADGQPLHVAQVAKQLARQGHEVDVLTRREDADTPTLVRLDDGVRVLQVPAGPPTFVAVESLLGYMPAFADASRRMLARTDAYDVVHAHFFMSGQVALSLREWFGWPVVVSFHSLGLVSGAQLDLFPSGRAAIEREIVRHADRLVATSPRGKADLMRLYGAQARRVAVVPEGVDSPALAEVYHDVIAEAEQRPRGAGRSWPSASASACETP